MHSKHIYLAGPINSLDKRLRDQMDAKQELLDVLNWAGASSITVLDLKQPQDEPVWFGARSRNSLLTMREA